MILLQWILKLGHNIWFAFNKKRFAREFKPRFVYWYILADGDQEKICQYMNDNYKVRNIRLWDSTMRSVNLDDYAFVLEKDFKKYCKDEYTFVVKKKVD